MTPYHVTCAWDADPIKTLGTSRSIHLIDLKYDKLGVGHEPYTDALIAGIQRRSDGNMEVWAVKEGSASVFVSPAFSPSLITSISGGTKSGIISAGAFVWLVAIFDLSASYAVQSVAAYQPAPAPSQAAGTQLGLIDFTGSPLVRAQELQVVPGFYEKAGDSGPGSVDLAHMPLGVLWS